MGKNIVRKTYNANDTWVAPAGVTSVNVKLSRAINFQTGRNASTAGGYHRGFLDIYNNLYTWGYNSDGGLGDGTAVSKSSPTLVVGSLKFKRFVMAPNDNGCCIGIDISGAAYAWGRNAMGQLGLGDVTNRSSPVVVPGGLTFVDVVMSSNATVNGSTYGITEDGSAYAWGKNTFGELGVGDVTPRSSPIAVLGALKFKSIIAGGGTTFGITTGGLLYFWGLNSSGQGGDGTITSRSSPVLVVGGLTFKKIISEGAAAAGLTTSGAIYCWGNNSTGMLGDGTIVNRSSPVAVLGSLIFKDFQISNASSAMGLTASGSLYGWGSNQFGMLGNGTITDKSSPVLVVGGLNFKAFASFANQQALGLTTAGVLYGWGYNANGGVGDGTVADKSSPVLVVGGLTFIKVFAENSSSFGITNDGMIYSWGTNDQGQLGDGSTTKRSSPVAILGTRAIDLSPNVSSKSMVVVPGTTYSIKLMQYSVMFGLEVVASGLYDELVLEYSS